MRRASGALLLVFAFGCAHYRGSATDVSWPPPAAERWLAITPFSGTLQTHHHDCGAAALASVLRHFGQPLRAAEASALSGEGTGSTARTIRDVARAHGLRSFLIAGTRSDLQNELRAGRPSVVGVLKPYGDRSIGHYEVVVALSEATNDIITFDPARGFSKNSWRGFEQEWAATGRVLLVFLPA
jgi:ABC-type bacteriocin/lantibiotic exporter with double-glycine peptidase domain